MHLELQRCSRLRGTDQQPLIEQAISIIIRTGDDLQYSQDKTAIKRANKALSPFKNVSRVAIAATTLLFVVTDFQESSGQAANNPQAIDLTAKTISEATGFFSSILDSTLAFLPKLGIALVVIVLGWLANKFVKKLMRSQLKGWGRVRAAGTLTSIGLFILTFSIAVSALAGDVRALLGSIGIVGLALSWALQVPIESFTGWLLNSFRNYYQIGDRIQVGDVFGDVFQIDILTTTVWQAGGPHQAVQAAQPTGALITFPNSEVLRANIINFTGDFAFVWDEVGVGVSNDSDLDYTMEIARRVLEKEMGQKMIEPAKAYQALLKGRELHYDISVTPTIYAQPTDSWTQIIARYIVDARQRRKTSSDIYLALCREMAKAEHKGKIISGYPRSQVERINQRGVAE